MLIPEQKAEPEDPKRPDELLVADRGGLVFVPKLGFTPNVAELDFVSQFPSIMARFNISPETVNCPCCPDAPRIPELGYRICQKRRGITSRVVERLIAKRCELKKLLKTTPPDTALRMKLQRDSMKWLLVCCFGYTGYKNARFGKIEAHEAINAVARETLLVAKEIAEADGFELIHALVDSLYVWKEGATREDYERLRKEPASRWRLNPSTAMWSFSLPSNTRMCPCRIASLRSERMASLKSEDLNAGATTLLPYLLECSTKCSPSSPRPTTTSRILKNLRSHAGCLRTMKTDSRMVK